jgi:hypothetical protein
MEIYKMNSMLLRYYIVFIAFICCHLSKPGFAQETGEEKLISVIGTGDIMLGSN